MFTPVTYTVIALFPQSSPILSTDTDFVLCFSFPMHTSIEKRLKLAGAQFSAPRHDCVSVLSCISIDTSFFVQSELLWSCCVCRLWGGLHCPSSTLCIV